MKAIQIKLDKNKLAVVTKAIPPAHLGTAMIIMASLSQNNHEAVQLLVPGYNPVCNSLAELGWIKIDAEFRPTLTDAGKKIVATFTAGKKTESVRAKAVDSWIKSWIAKWPRVKQPFSGKYLAGDEKVLAKKMKWFIDEYDYSPAEIEFATIQYLHHHYKNGWQHVRLATYFIYHDDQSKLRTSDLASWCDAVRHPATQQTNRFSRTLG